MAQSVIAPIIPNMGLQGEAMAGASAIIFTSTDREIIKARGGDEVDKSRSFKEIFSNRGLTPKVENEQTTVNPEQDIRALEYRQREHQKMMKHSVIAVPRERVEISDSGPVNQPITPAVVIETVQRPRAAAAPAKQEELHPETAAIVKELNLDPSEIFDNFSLEQKELYSLVYRIKELHLKRLLSASREEFVALSEEIKNATLAAAKPEARAWLESQLDKLTGEAVNYKLRLLRSLQSLEFDAQREENINWLNQAADRIAKAS